MAEFDVSAFIDRFADRAAAVKERGIPPLEGEARRAFIASAEQDFQDYSLVASASFAVEDGKLVLRIPLG
ncbi:MAG TPA: hypothetical protein VLD62_11640 [Acidimicrobiia bacterium]|nr:hypothetical protein [Acidimicrobiia bacterium]